MTPKQASWREALELGNRLGAEAMPAISGGQQVTTQAGLTFEYAQPRDLIGFVRGVIEEAEENEFLLSQILPNANIDDIEYRFTTGDIRDQDVALVRAWDAESPIGGRQGIQRIMGELPPISKKIRLGEEERLRMRALERGNNEQIVRALYNDTRLMGRAVAARVEMLRGEALYTGKLEINENGVRQSVDFGRLSSHTVTAATVWSNVAAPIIGDIRTWSDLVVADSGVKPGLAMTSQTVVSNMLRNDEVRTYSGLGVVAGVPPLVTETLLAQVLSAHGLPPIFPYDAMVRVAGVQTRVIPSDRFVLLPPANIKPGGTLFGITAEALELQGAQLIGADLAPGVVAVQMRTFDPVSIWTKAAGVCLPILGDPDTTLAADVL